jgi:hypothetical protein
MRVFYIDESESKLIRNYYVKIDNVNVPEELKGYKCIEAISKDDLVNQVKKIYKLTDKSNIVVQLWGQHNYVGERLDIREEIPKDIEFMYVRVVPNKPENL